MHKLSSSDEGGRGSAACGAEGNNSYLYCWEQELHTFQREWKRSTRNVVFVQSVQREN